MSTESPLVSASAVPSRPCPRCLSLIPDRAPGGLCPRCLLDGANAPTDDGLGPQSWKTPTLAEIASAFPNLEVLGHLGTGGMGCVYRVRERDSGRISALKVLPRELAADPAFVERFEREARTLARLRHPHIVGVHGFGQAGGFCFLLMEFVDGASLRQALRSGRFTPQQALALIPPICEALQTAHAQGVLHRDIKPENLLLDAEGRVKIADFGIAKLLEGPGASSAEEYTLTRTGARIGTPHYMAPEQVETPDQVDHRADIYSLGVVFYELLTGELPLGRFPAPSIKAGLDARVDDIVFRALAKERELRQQTADQVKAEVEGLGKIETLQKVERWARGMIRSRFGVRTRFRVVGTVAVAVLAAWALLTVTVRFLQQSKSRVDRIAGVNRLKNIGLAYRTHVSEVDGLISNINTLTGQPVVIFGPELTDTSPDSILAVAPGGSDLKNPTVLFADGSVEQLSEARFQERLSRASPSYRAAWEHFQRLGLFGQKDLMTDPRTGKPYLFFLATSGTNPSPDEMLAVSPPDPDTQGRSVLLGDGSVQQLSKAQFRDRMSRASPAVRAFWGFVHGER